MNYLKGKRCYLSSPIEFDDHAFDWRKKTTTVIRDELGVELFDPTADDKQKMVHPLQEALDREDYDTVKKIAKSFVRKDLCLVDRSDFLVAHVPHAVATTGTVHEIILSDMFKKPTLLVCPQGKNKTAKWYFGIINPDYIFGSWQDLYNYLCEVTEGKHKDDDRWAYVYGLV